MFNPNELSLHASDTSGASNANIISSEDVFTSSSVGTIFETKTKDGLCIDDTLDSKSVSMEAALPANSTSSYLTNPVKLMNETEKRNVAFVSVKLPMPSSTTNESGFDLKGMEKNGERKEDSFFSLLTGGNNMSSLL
ncbi:hypothetical protein BUALT_Bualt18G0064100 [Buddleja alternifolia]|uniref:Uncharacterized protein n=1 Tax=Buddleja alternifolia TaxID=168488 RepID=A0AAV6WDE1_9LAMI|nr:hypothetical protein BUALT_Bualt18G0064100 [Buddleja alternifolia]